VTLAPPSDAEQLAFLSGIQRILEEGRFTATYKFALLIALTDIAVEQGGESGAPLRVPLASIAERFIELYWGHTRPFAGGVLQQNAGANIALVRHLTAMQAAEPVLAVARRRREWPRLVARVAGIVRAMPLFRLQLLRGDAELRLLYDPIVIDGAITLLPGVGFCLRRFSGLIRTLARNAWLDEIRALPANRFVVADAHSLPDFLFGSERTDLTRVREILLPMQAERCFYCGERMRHGAHVDHFVPFALYPADLAHNLVLADATCNGDKSSLLADLPFLERWMERNERHGAEIGGALASGPLRVDAASANGVAGWAYRRAADARSLLWSGYRSTRTFPADAALPFAA